MFFAPKVFVALFCGGLVGLERELKHKAAGIKTNMLICAGSALFSAVSLIVSQSFNTDGRYADPGRIAAQIVSGIGFIGGGAIIQARGTVVGMTTAASIWVVSAIGVCVGFGYSSVAIGATCMVVVVLIVITFFERRLLGRVTRFGCEIAAHDPQSALRKDLDALIRSCDLDVDGFDMEKNGDALHISLRYQSRREDHRRFMMELWKTQGVHEVKQR